MASVLCALRRPPPAIFGSSRAPLILKLSCQSTAVSRRLPTRSQFRAATTASTTSAPRAQVVEETPSKPPSEAHSTHNDNCYNGPLTTTFRRLKIFSLSSLTLSFALTPFIFVIETTSGLPMVARFALAGIALSTGSISTALVAWCGRPYVTTLRWLETPTNAKQEVDTLEMTTLTLALNERRTRVYDPTFLVPTSRPFATWELAEAFRLPSAEAANEKTKGGLPREETVAETMDKNGGVLGRWVVRWDESGMGTCREVGQVVRYFNVHQELLDRPIT